MMNHIITKKYEVISRKYRRSQKRPDAHTSYLILHTPTSRGFTLVETLVAIAVLMIAIAGPLVVASKGLAAALYARDQMIASYLAQESMEVIKNTRDNGKHAYSSWIGWAASCVRDSSNPNAACNALPLPNDPEATLPLSIPASCDVDDGECKIYLSDDGYVTDSGVSGAQATLFRRYFFITPKSAQPLDAGGRDALVTVVVSWKQGTIPNELRLSSELVDSTR